MKDLHDIRILIYIYLLEHISLRDQVNMSLYHLIKSCGYSISSLPNGINAKALEILKKFEDIKILSKNSGDFVGNKLCNLTFKPNILSSKVESAIIYLKEIDMISDYVSDKSVSLSRVLLLLAYIRSNKLIKSSTNKNLKKTTFSYKHKKYMAKDLSMSESIVDSCIDVLQNLDLIVTSQLPPIKNRY